MCELGWETQARTEFEDIAARDFAGLPFDNKWVFSMSLLSEVAYFLKDSHRAKILYQKLLPYAERNGLSAGDGCTGSVSRYLGLLATVSSRRRCTNRMRPKALVSNSRSAPEKSG